MVSSTTSDQLAAKVLSMAGRFIGLAIAVGCLIVMLFQASAIAMPNDAASIEMERAADQLDQVAGQGTSDQIQGKVKQDIGTVKRELGQVAGQVEGVANQVEGRAQQDIGRVAEAGDKAENALEDTAGNIMDSVKELFGE